MFYYATKMRSNIFLVVIFACTIAALAGVTSLTPTADTFLDNSQPDTNFGTSSIGYVFTDTLGIQYELICMFGISTLPSTIINATVTYQQQYQSDQEIAAPYIIFDAWEIPTNWTETTATWNNSPAPIRRFLRNYQDNNTYNVIFNVTSIVNEAKTAGKTSVAFKIGSIYPQVQVFMREAFISYRPSMIVYY